MIDLSPILISETQLATVTRVMFVSGSTINVRRELFDGKHVGSVFIFAGAHAALRAGLDAAREGREGEWSAPTRGGGRIAFISAPPLRTRMTEGQRLLIELRRPDGTAHGRPTDLRGSELDRLAEAHRIAAYVAAGN